MNNGKILKKAIEKAVKNGYSNKHYYGKYLNISIENMVYDILEHNTQYIKLLFSHEFAKAFFGETKRAHLIEPDGVYGGHSFLGGEIESLDDSSIIFHVKDWRYHLQEMVLEEDPIKYLENFL